MNSFKIPALICLFIGLVQIKSSITQNVRRYRNSKLNIEENQVNVTVDSESVQFFIIGDFGGIPYFPYRTPIEEAIADQMSKMSEQYDTQFQLEIGDNFYFEGVTNVTDKRFQVSFFMIDGAIKIVFNITVAFYKQTFEDVFDKKGLDTPWFVLLGNHDHRGNAHAQIEYTNFSKKWIMPDYNYTINIRSSNSDDDLISILMIDTVLLCGNTGDDNEHDQPRFNTLKEQMLAELYFQSVEDELKRISQTSVSYILVAGHFPVWSISHVGPVQCLVDRLRPLLHKYKVNTYFCGHEHNLQHITDTYLNATVEYIVTGAANINQNSTEHIQDIPLDSLQFYWSVPKPEELLIGGGTLILANQNNMTIRYFSTTGKILFDKVIFPREK